MYTKSVCATNFGSLGEIGANFSSQLSSRTQFAKISSKKVFAENQCEKHKTSSLNGIDLVVWVHKTHIVGSGLFKIHRITCLC